MQFDMLVARQSKSDIRNLTCMRNPTFGTQQDQNTYGRVRGSVRIYVLETLKDLSQNGKHIDLKPEQEAAIGV